MIDLFKALGDYTRLRLLNIISREELCVCELEVILGISQTNVSRHVAKLRSNKIVESYKTAQWTHFKIHRQFKQNHKNLYEYLQAEFATREIFKEDTRKYNLYKKNEYNCTIIRKNKDLVIKTISQKTPGKPPV